ATLAGRGSLQLENALRGHTQDARGRSARTKAWGWWTGPKSLKVGHGVPPRLRGKSGIPAIHTRTIVPARAALGGGAAEGEPGRAAGRRYDLTTRHRRHAFSGHKNRFDGLKPLPDRGTGRGSFD